MSRLSGCYKINSSLFTLLPSVTHITLRLACSFCQVSRLSGRYKINPSLMTDCRGSGNYCSTSINVTYIILSGIFPCVATPKTVFRHAGSELVLFSTIATNINRDVIHYVKLLVVIKSSSRVNYVDPRAQPIMELHIMGEYSKAIIYYFWEPFRGEARSLNRVKPSVVPSPLFLEPIMPTQLTENCCIVKNSYLFAA